MIAAPVLPRILRVPAHRIRAAATSGPCGPVALSLCPVGGPEPAAAFYRGRPCQHDHCHTPFSAYSVPCAASFPLDPGADRATAQLCQRRSVLQPDRRRNRRHPQCSHRQNPSPRPGAGAANGGAGPFLPATRPAAAVVAATPVLAPDRLRNRRALPVTTWPRTRRSTRRNAARSPNWRKANAIGRSAIHARRISPFAATKRSRASPIAPVMPAWPIGCRHGGALSRETPTGNKQARFRHGRAMGMTDFEPVARLATPGQTWLADKMWLNGGPACRGEQQCDFFRAPALSLRLP